MKKPLILSNQNNYLHEFIRDKVDANSFADTDKLEPCDWLDLADDKDCLIDLSVLPHQEKIYLYDTIREELELPMVCDFACQWGEYFLTHFDFIKGGGSFSFYSPTRKVEVFAQTSEAKSLMDQFLKSLGLEGVEVSSPGFGMSYPRVLSTIINEAFFSLEEELSDMKNIDTAMKFGVNYPLGPFEWAEKMGTAPIYFLLENLYFHTKELRYRPSLKLRAEALKEIPQLYHF